MCEISSGGKLAPAIIVGAISSIDNFAAALAIGALIFSGPLAPGMGLGIGAIVIGGAILTLIVALRSTLKNSIALTQETSIAILSAAILSMVIHSSQDETANIATAIAIIGASALVTGILFWVVGRFRLGGLVRFLPYPVVAGFLAGSGWLLVDGAAAMLTGNGFGMDFLNKLADINLLWLILPALLFAIVMYVSLETFTHSATMVIVMGVAIALFYVTLIILDISSETARSMGHLPPLANGGNIQIPTPSLLTHVNWQAVLDTLPAMIVIAGLSMIGLMLNISGMELALGKDIDVNAELRSTGMANVFSGGIGGAPGYVALSMTVLAEKAGATGRAAGVLTAIFMLLALFVGGSLVFQVPVFFTAGFILFLGFELLKNWFLDTRKSMPLSEWLIVLAILLVVAIVGFMEGLAVGLLISSAMFLFKYSRLPVVRFQSSAKARRSTVDRSPSDSQYLTEHGEAIEVVQLQGYLFFGTADRIVDIVRRRLGDTAKPSLQYIILDFQNVSGADSAAITCFLKIQKLVEIDQVVVFFTNLSQELKDHLNLAGISFDDSSLMRQELDLDYALEASEEAILAAHHKQNDANTLLKHFTTAIGKHPKLSDFIKSLDTQEMQPGETLITQGENADDVFFVADGRVSVQITLPTGKRLRVRTMLSGAVVGEVALYLKQTRSADVIVDMPSTICRLSSKELKRMEAKDPDLAIIAHKLLASNLSEKLSVANKAIQLAQN